MQPTDTLAHQMLALLINAGGSWTVKLSSTVPALVSGAYTNITEITTIPSATISRATASWSTPASREVHPASDVTFGTASGDSTPVAWVFYTSGVAVLAGRIVDLSVHTGDPVVGPKETFSIKVPG